MWPLKLIIQPVLQSGFEFSLRRHSDNHLSFFFSAAVLDATFWLQNEQRRRRRRRRRTRRRRRVEKLAAVQTSAVPTRWVQTQEAPAVWTPPPPHVPKNKHPKTLKTQSLPRLVLRRVGTKNATVKSTTSQGLSSCGRWDSLLLPLLLLPTRRGQVHPHTLR